jgi:hypothetical protein
MADFAKKKEKPKAKPGDPWGIIIIILLVSAALGKLGFGMGGEMATSTPETASSTSGVFAEPPADKPPVTIGQ